MLYRLPERLRPAQNNFSATGGIHASGIFDLTRELLALREDVGRHNALDKLIGAMARQGLAWENSFALLSSRCSYELVEKAVLAGCPLLATVSAATRLAAARASAAGLQLVSLVRHDSLSWHQGGA